MRLQKFMADCGVASRRKCEEFISEGKVTVNGSVAQIGTVIDPSADVVEFNGTVLKPQAERIVIMLNKPKGVICSNFDPEGRKTTGDYFANCPYRLYHIGRLDYDSEGLLLLTNDGDLANRIMHPRYMTEKTYYAVCDGELTKEQKNALERGVLLSDGMTAPSKVKFVKPVCGNRTSLQITVHEGRNRQVRRMLEAVGHKTLLLRRIKLGKLELGELRTGEWRYVTPKELSFIAPDS